MALDRFENIDEVLGLSPSYGETFLSKDRNLLENLSASISPAVDRQIKAEVRISSAGYVGRTAGLLKEIHVYSDDEYLDSLYDEPIQDASGSFYFKPEQDLRVMGFDQGSYNMVYNTMYKFTGDVEDRQMVIEQVSSDRTEVKVKIRSKYEDQIGLQQSVITLKEFYDDEAYFNRPTFATGLEEFVLNCGENKISDISHILFEGTKVKRAPYPTSNFRGLPTIWIKTQITSGDGRRGSYFVEYYINGNQPTNRGAFWRLGAPPSISTVNETPPQLDEFENLNWYIERWTETDYTKGFSLPPHNFSQDYIGAPLYFWHGIPNFSNSGPSIDAQLSAINNTVDILIENQKNKRQEKWERRYIAGLALATGISVGVEYDPPGAGLGYFLGAGAAGGAAVGAGVFTAGAAPVVGSAAGSALISAAGGGTVMIPTISVIANTGQTVVGTVAYTGTTATFAGAAGGLSATGIGAIVVIVALLTAGGIAIGNKETFEGELERTLRAYEEIIGYHRNSLNRQFNGVQWQRGVSLGELSLNTINAANFLIDECKRNIEQLDREYDALPNRKKNNAEGRIIERYLRVHSVIALQVRAWIRAQKLLQENGAAPVVAPDNSEFGVYAITNEFLGLNLDLKPIPNFANRVQIWLSGVPYRVINTTSNATQTYTGLILKLYKPLPDDVEIGTRIGIYGRLQKSFIEKIIAWRVFQDLEEPFWSEPNFNIPLDGWGKSVYTDYKTWKDLLPISSSNRVIDKYFSQKPQNLNIDYSNFSNFIKYSSAVERLDVFLDKMIKLRNYEDRITELKGIPGPYSLVNITQSLSKIDEITTNFDAFENWLYYYGSGSYESNYYTSESLYTHYKFDNSIVPYPKTQTNPHIFYHPTGSIVESWYNGVYSSASLFDSQNDSKLSKLIPVSIAEDKLNDDYIKFVDMTGHFFDMIWNAAKEITSTNDREEHPEDGMPDELLYSVANSLGWKLADGYGDSSLWDYSVGITTSGSLSPTSASSAVSNLAVVKPKQKVKYEIWRRILNNLPYIYKTKGTRQSIEAIMSCYGISDKFLKIKEYGGPIITASLSVHDNQFFVGGMLQNNTNNKIRIESSTMSGDYLDIDQSRISRQFDDAPLDSNLLGVYFSTTDTLNTHMYSWSFQSTGNYSIIDDWFGDPIDRKKTYYPSLRITSSKYFDYLNSSEGITYQNLSPTNLLLELASNYDDSIFSQINQLIPARANYYSGILIEPHILERNKLHWPGDAKIEIGNQKLTVSVPIHSGGGISALAAPPPGTSAVNAGYSSMMSNYSGIATQLPAVLQPTSNTIVVSSNTPQITTTVQSRTANLSIVPYVPTGNSFMKSRTFKSAKSISYIGQPPTVTLNNGQSIYRYDQSNLNDALQPSEIQPGLNNMMTRGSKWNKSFDGTPVVEVYTADPFTLNAASTTGVFGGLSTQIASNPKGISAVRNVLLEQPRIPISPSAGGVAPSSNQSAGTLNTLPPTGPTPPES